jgi:hypothetical protein
MSVDRKKKQRGTHVTHNKKNQEQELNLQYQEKCSRKHKNSAIHILSYFVSGLHIIADDELRK